LGPNTGALVPRVRPQAGLGIGAGGASCCGDPGYHPPKFRKTQMLTCILVTTSLITGLPRTCISEQTTSTLRAKSIPNFNFFAVVAPLVVRTKINNHIKIMKQYCCECSLLFLQNTAKKLGTNTMLVPFNLKVGGPVSPGPYGC